jgi:hypothetical protein
MSDDYSVPLRKTANRFFALGGLEFGYLLQCEGYRYKQTLTFVLQGQEFVGIAP